MPKSPLPELPVYCHDNVEANRYSLFATLREMWRKQREDAGQVSTYAELARLLEVPRQSVTQWATGSGDKSPAPWHILMRLCHWCEVGIRLEPEKVALYRRS